MILFSGFDYCNICRFFPEKAESLALDILKELVEVSAFLLLYLRLRTVCLGCGGLTFISKVLSSGFH